MDKRRRMERRLGLNTSREFRRAQNFKACQQRGYHLSFDPPRREEKTMGGKLYEMELCKDCDVWVEPAHFLHDDLQAELDNAGDDDPDEWANASDEDEA